MTQLRFLATALVLLVGCTMEHLTDSDSDLALDPTASAPDLAGATDDTAPPPTAQGAAAEASSALDSSTDTRPRLPGQGEPCLDGRCARGLTCIEYYGIGGPAAGLFTSCEIPCGPAGECPRGQSCITIYDGPGQVCRPPQG